MFMMLSVVLELGFRLFVDTVLRIRNKLKEFSPTLTRENDKDDENSLNMLLTQSSLSNKLSCDLQKP